MSEESKKKTGVDSVVEMLSHMDEPSRKKLLENVAARDPGLAATITDRLFQFSDLQRLSGADFQKVLQAVPTGLLALALKTADDSMKNFVFANLATRAVQTLRDEMSGLGLRRVSDVGIAQTKIIEIAKVMAAEGKIRIPS